ncbi:MAG: histidine kinase [Spirochaetes bacterium]|jgi:signal transduction histidine kinase|nr:histidine kinase [Spirochaetota bacterium]
MEITEPIRLTVEEESLLDMHSVLNVLNVINYELHTLAIELGDPEPIVDAADAVADIGDALRDPDEAKHQIENVESFIAGIDASIEAACAQRGECGDLPSVSEVRENLAGVYAVLRVRAREIVARSGNPMAWVRHDVAQLRENFLHVFRAIERNSKGGYQIVYNLAQHRDGTYYVTLEIDSVDGTTIRMPAVFQDVMRDLIANARKYTDPGGRIQAGLHHDGRELRFVVEDTGRGMEAAEIPRLISFGERGRNIQDRPTRGGGFGLTKAYYVTKRLNGRMWIDSTVGEGTRIEIRIPAEASQGDVLGQAEAQEVAT